MNATLAGRLQTRSLLALLVGLPVALLMALLLGGVTVPGALLGLAAITVLGLGWEAAYHALQERRRERDWPPAFRLASWGPEAIVSWLVLQLLGAGTGILTHLAFFTPVWLGGLVAAALVPVVHPRWRHEGGRILVGRAGDAPRTAAATAPRPARPRLAVLGLFLGVVAAIVVLAPLLDDSTPAPTADAAPTPSATKPPAPQRGKSLSSWDTSARVRPAYVEYAGARIATPLFDVRLNEKGALTTPDRRVAAWYADGAAPGQKGPAVLVGNSETVFRTLGAARAGQRLRVIRADGSQVNFRVDRVLTVDAARFPTDDVYGASTKPLLRLVGYAEDSGRNVVVFAHAVSLVRPPAKG